MESKWTQEEVDTAAMRASPGGLTQYGIRQIMSAAVSLFLSRASGRAGEDAEELRMTAEHAFGLADERYHGDVERIARLAALAQEAEPLRARVAELEGELSDTKATWSAESLRAGDAMAEVERLKLELSTETKTKTDMADRAARAESRVAAIRETVTKARAELRHTYGHVALGQSINPDLVARAIRLLEGVDGDAPQEAKSTRIVLPITSELVAEMDRAVGLPVRYPCTPSCTHDDARTPGHPERVNERSEAVTRVAAPDSVGDLAKQAGAKPGREVASYRAGYEQGCDDMRAAVEKWAREYFGEVPPTLKVVLDEVAS